MKPTEALESYDRNLHQDTFVPKCKRNVITSAANSRDKVHRIHF